MSKRRPPYPLEFSRQLVELVRAGRTPEELAGEFEPTAQAIRNWVRQADRDQLAKPSVPRQLLHGGPSVRFELPNLDLPNPSQNIPLGFSSGEGAFLIIGEVGLGEGGRGSDVVVALVSDHGPEDADQVAAQGTERLVVLLAFRPFAVVSQPYAAPVRCGGPRRSSGRPWRGR
jgi:transposase